MLFAQEVCDNGIDDDGNGLIDLQDSACYCKGSYDLNSVKSIVPNYSFENKSCCPIFSGEMNCVDDWGQPSFPATTDYLNTCGYPNLPLNPPPPSLIDGNGYVGFAYVIAVNFNPYKEYAGVCLLDTLFAGESYKISFQIAYSYGVLTNTFSVFGSSNCSDLPFTFSGHNDCPLLSNAGNWEELGSKTITLDRSKWNQIEINFTPTEDLSNIVIGPGCGTEKSHFSYCYLDQVIMNEVSESRPYISTQGSLCQENLVLSLEFDSVPNEIQWYKNGIALAGETSHFYILNDGEEATYKARLLYDSGCITLTYDAYISEYELEMPNVFTPNNDNINDIFKPIKFECISKATFSIYNRWGQKVHESSNIPFSWNGKSNEKDCSSGVYYWTVDLEAGDENKKESGTVSLFR